ncbi:DUF4848 domain-containing protein [Spirosoma sp. HMF4905]|uniref:DUF4848 domain-containing protein n=1 Tax=Spirosoma arboris TaxID=2682092 RepID=A0A7K1SIL1_9BACT|nr:DUF4848 domain-containing protein [Spirosoma arboris]MVM33613.1 DUF4848 domain-containing protein [Spirosoma arboris]
MKNLSIPTTGWMVFILMLVSLSCKESFDVSQLQKNQDGVVNNGVFLEFSNSKVYQEQLTALKTMTEEEMNKWEKNLNFISVRSFYDLAISEDKKYIENLTIDQATNANGVLKDPSLLHSKFVLENKSSFLFDEYGRSFWIKSPTADKAQNSVINKDGLLKVGGYLMQFTDMYTKVMYVGKNFSSNDLEKIKSAITTSTSDRINVAMNNFVQHDARARDSRTQFYEESETESTNPAGIHQKIALWTVAWNNPEYTYDPQTDQQTFNGYRTHEEMNIRTYFWGGLFNGSVYSDNWHVTGTFDVNCESGYSLYGPCQHRSYYYNSTPGQYTSGGTAVLEQRNSPNVSMDQYSLDYPMHITNLNFSLSVSGTICTITF